MLNRILVPLDGSSQSESALPLAARLARAEGSQVVLVRAIRALAEVEMGVVSAEGWAPAVDPKERDEATAYLNEVAQGEVLSGVAVQTVIATGPAAAAILAVANKQRIELIVMTSREREGLSRWLLGSVARQVAREAAVPALVLRVANGKLVAPAASSLERGTSWSALVALDGSALAESALVPATQLITELSAPAPTTLNLLRVVELVPTLGTTPYALGVPGGFGLADDLYTGAMDEAQAYLNTIADHLREQLAADHFAADVRITTTALLSADVAGTIAAIAEGRKATADAPVLAPSNLIAVATHGHGGLKRLILGSVTERLLDSTALPVLVAPSEAAATEG
ncbi:MAG TPA: universal stress protein [Ktedonobacterales bacterium]